MVNLIFEFFFLYHYNPFKKPVVTFSINARNWFLFAKALVMLDY